MYSCLHKFYESNQLMSSLGEGKKKGCLTSVFEMTLRQESFLIHMFKVLKYFMHIIMQILCSLEIPSNL